MAWPAPAPAVPAGAVAAGPLDGAAEADTVVVNTCGFIDAAKKESIDAMVEAGRLPAMRAALLAPIDRNESYAASTPYSRAYFA